MEFCFTKRLGVREMAALIILIVLLGVFVYGRTLNSPFVLDDIHSIVKNEARRSIDVSLSNWLGTRTIPYITLDLNYYFGELDVYGYHVVNISLHLLTTVVVTVLMYLVSRRSYRRREWRFGALKIDNYWLFGIAAGLVFLTHPLQTQSVNYVVQRMVLMATLFYLSSILFYWLHRESRRISMVWLWGVLSVVSAILSMHSKEIAATLPVAIVIIEYVFFSRSWVNLVRRWFKLLPWLITMLIIPAYMLEVRAVFIHSPDVPPHALDDSVADKISMRRIMNVSAETTEVSRGVYLMTQWRVLVKYVRLLFWPVGQNIDHDIPYQTSFWDPITLGSLLFVLVIMGGGVWLYRKKRVVSAAGVALFFLALSVESSVIPIKDTIFEHRLYLSMIGFVLVVVDVLSWGVGRLYLDARMRGWAKNIIFGLALSVVVILSAVSLIRNGVWESELDIWTDAVSKSPVKARPMNNLGLAYVDLGRAQEAEEIYRRALEANPDNVEVMINLGVLLGQERRTDEAVKVLSRGIELRPQFASGYVNLGNVYMLQGKYSEAEGIYREALFLKKGDHSLWASIGDALIKQEKSDEAIDAYERAVDYNQAEADWLNRLGALYAMSGRYGEAKNMFNRALEVDPELSAAKSNLRRLERDLRRQ
jgi:Flp pilus assembly protein TadD